MIGDRAFSTGLLDHPPTAEDIAACVAAARSDAEQQGNVLVGAPLPMPVYDGQDPHPALFMGPLTLRKVHPIGWVVYCYSRAA
jgi:hypothetical protein